MSHNNKKSIELEELAHYRKCAFMYKHKVYCWMCLPVPLLDEHVMELSDVIDRHCEACSKLIPRENTILKKTVTEPKKDTGDSLWKAGTYLYRGNYYCWNCLPVEAEAYTKISGYMVNYCTICKNKIEPVYPVNGNGHYNCDHKNNSKTHLGANNAIVYPPYVPPVNQDLLFIKRLGEYESNPAKMDEKDIVELFTMMAKSNIHIDLGGKYAEKLKGLLGAGLIDEKLLPAPKVETTAIVLVPKPQRPSCSSCEQSDASKSKVIAEKVSEAEMTDFSEFWEEDSYGANEEIVACAVGQLDNTTEEDYELDIRNQGWVG